MRGYTTRKYTSLKSSRIVLFLKLDGRYMVFIGMWNSTASLDNNLKLPQKVKHRITSWVCNSILRYLFKKNEVLASAAHILRKMKSCLRKILSLNIHSCTIHNNPEVQTTQMPISGWMDKQTVVYPCGGILFGHKKEWSTDISYNMNVPWKHYPK